MIWLILLGIVSIIYIIFGHQCMFSKNFQDKIVCWIADMSIKYFVESILGPYTVLLGLCFLLILLALL